MRTSGYARRRRTASPRPLEHEAARHAFQWHLYVLYKYGMLSVHVSRRSRSCVFRTPDPGTRPERVPIDPNLPFREA